MCQCVCIAEHDMWLWYGGRTAGGLSVAMLSCPGQRLECAASAFSQSTIPQSLAVHDVVGQQSIQAEHRPVDKDEVVGSSTEASSRDRTGRLSLTYTATTQPVNHTHFHPFKLTVILLHFTYSNVKLAASNSNYQHVTRQRQYDQQFHTVNDSTPIRLSALLSRDTCVIHSSSILCHLSPSLVGCMSALLHLRLSA